MRSRESIHYIEAPFMRDLPTEVPDEIAFIIRRNWGDMATFAKSSKGLEYDVVYSVLCRSNHKVLNTVGEMANAVGMDIDLLAKFLLIPNIEHRRAALAAATDDISHNEWAKRSGISQPTISYQIKNPEQKQLKNLVSVVYALGLTLSQFASAYKEHQTLAS